jgi:transcriptional regulator with XRE-family HTH domain
VSRDIHDEERQRRFARNLRAARERARLTQAGVAEKLGMNDEVYARYERAKMWPGIDKLGRLCEILDCSADSLFGTDEAAPTPAEPPPDEDSPAVRRLLRRLRKAKPRTVRLVSRMLNDLESCARADEEGNRIMSEERRILIASESGIAIRSAKDITDMIGACFGADGLVLREEDLAPEFFDLETGLAGELLQKCVNYGLRAAIVVPRPEAHGERFRELAYEHRSHNLIRFVRSREEADAWLRA